MDKRGLTFADEHQPSLRRALQIGGDSFNPIWRQLGRIGYHFDANRRRQCTGKGFNLPCAQRQPVIRGATSNGGCALDHVKAIAHAVGDTIGRAATIGKIARITHMAWRVKEKISIQTHNHIGLVKVVNWLNRLAKGERRTRINLVAIHRFILMPACLGKTFQYSRPLALQGGRGRAFGEDA